MSEPLTLRVNRAVWSITSEPHATLLTALRDQIGLTGTKEGCDDSECGACMVLLDGEPINSCSYLAHQVSGREVTTVEGLGQQPGQLSDLQERFLKEGAVQCGFCTPGILISATALLDRNENPSEEEIRLALAGNLCRCTGYQKIVGAVLAVAVERTALQKSSSSLTARP